MERRRETAARPRLSRVMRLLSLVAMPLLTLAPRLPAQSPDLPPVARRGLDLLVRDSTDAAVDYWTTGWDGPENEGKREQLIAGFRQIRDLGGRVNGYDALKIERVSPHLIRVFVLVRYEQLPVFFELIAYDGGGATPAWRMATVRFNTEPTKVLPAEVWARP